MRHIKFSVIITIFNKMIMNSLVIFISSDSFVRVQFIDDQNIPN